MAVEQVVQPDRLALRAQTTGLIRELCGKFFKAEELKDGKGSPEQMRKVADSALATEVVVSIYNMFGVMAGSTNHSPESAIADLVFVLNTNPFWLKNATYLMPIVNASVNAFLDNIELRAKPEVLWSKMEYHNKFVWLEVLPAIMFCYDGYSRMRQTSLEMKKTFENLLR